jgi:hypothetical protein
VCVEALVEPFLDFGHGSRDSISNFFGDSFRDEVGDELGDLGGHGSIEVRHRGNFGEG